MPTASMRDKSRGLTRRRFLQTSSGLIGLTVLGVALPKHGTAQAWSPTPGVAGQRIEGITKVTGGKIYARDFNARDMGDQGWPDTQWYAMFLRALTTTRAFEGANVTGLPDHAQPTKLILGNELASGQLNPKLTLSRDILIDEAVLRVHGAHGAKDDDYDFDHPKGLEFDLVVRPGNRPDFLGQATAMLLFDTKSAYRAAKAAMQFNDAAYQNYGPEIGPNPDEPKVFDPETTYVRVADPNDPKGGFSFFNSTYEDYPKQTPKYQAIIEEYLKSTPDLIRHDFTTDMRAMDPMFMEPESGLIWYDKPNTTLHVLLGTQSPDGDVDELAGMYGSTGSRLRVTDVILTSCYPGGGFGGRDKSPFSLMLGLCADFADGNPVKLEYDRFEQFRVGLKRHACDLTGTLAVLPDQTMQVIAMDMEFDGGGRKNLSPYVASLAALCAGGSYKLPMANVFAKAIHSENISGGSQRGFGGPQAFFAIETAIDEVAAQQGWDPIAFRAKNALADQDTTIVGGPVDQELRLGEMLDIAQTHPLWANRAALQAQYSTDEIAYGTGVAMSLQAYGTSGDGVVAAITLNPDGTYDVQSDAVDMGNGSATTLGVVIGDILGANASTVEMGGYTLFDQTGLTANRYIGCDDDFKWSDPTLTKKGVGSSSACLTGLHQVHVVQQTAHAVMANTILPAAAKIWGQIPAKTTWVDGHLTADGAEPLPLPLIAQIVYEAGFDKGAVAHGYFQQSWVSAEFDTGSGAKRFDLDGLAYYPSAGGAAVVQTRRATQAMDCQSARAARYVWAPCVNVMALTVHRKTGVVQIENALSVLNAGRVHVEPLVSGQSQGGMAMAIGYSLLEDMPKGMDGPANGTWNLNRYHIARMGDVPMGTVYRPDTAAQELIILPETPGDLKQGRGVAEAVMCSVAPAISNALRDATGKRFTSLPITPAKILEGLAK